MRNKLAIMTSETFSSASELLDDLVLRGLCQDSTDKAALTELLDSGSQKLFVGFDPTADSLHVGSLLGLMTLKRFADAGHIPILLLGGATGMVGDPSGRSDERNLLDKESLASNLAGIEQQVKAMLGDSVLVMNNFDWFDGISLLDFLRDVGKHVPISHMIAKDAVKSRMNTEAGISFTEFSYMLLQAHDFWWLQQNHACKLQLGGSDQWGNITAGIDLIRRRSGVQAHGLTWPLLTRSDGQKFGKTADGNIWLSDEKTSAFGLHQHFLQSDDRDVERLLKQLTLVSLEEIAELMAEHKANPSGRIAQSRLADEVTGFVYGEQETEHATLAGKALFSNGQVSSEDLVAAQATVPHITVKETELETQLTLAKLLKLAGLCKSTSDARRQLEQSAVKINNKKMVADISGTELAEHLLDHRLLLQKGKHRKCIILVE